MPFFVKNGDGDCGETQRLISPWQVRTYGSNHSGLGSEGIHLQVQCLENHLLQ